MTHDEVTAAMRPEDVDPALVEKVARAIWEHDTPAPELGWPHWDVAVERAANGLWDLPQMVADTRAMARHALAAVVPEIQAQALRDAAEDLDLPGSTATGYYASEAVGGYNDAERDVEAWLVKRAARLTATTEEPTT